MPLTRPVPKAMMRSMGSVTMRLARVHTPSRSKMSVQLRLSRKSSTACRIELPISPSALSWPSAQAATLSTMPWLSSACVISGPPGISWIIARSKLAAVRGTARKLTGLKPSSSANMLKPGIQAALSAKKSSASWMPSRWTVCGSARSRTAVSTLRCTVCCAAPCWIVCVSSCAINSRPAGTSGWKRPRPKNTSRPLVKAAALSRRLARAASSPVWMRTFEKSA